MMRSNGTNGTIPRGLSFLEPRCHLVVTLGLALLFVCFPINLIYLEDQINRLLLQNMTNFEP